MDTFVLQCEANVLKKLVPVLVTESCRIKSFSYQSFNFSNKTTDELQIVAYS